VSLAHEPVAADRQAGEDKRSEEEEEEEERRRSKKFAISWSHSIYSLLLFGWLVA
jgi:hypothetical protein